MGLWTAILWLQISPISTHRPTQGINAFIVEPQALQIESGYQPFWVPRKSPTQETVLQVRKGMLRKWEGILTAGIDWAGFSVMPLSFAIKGYLLSQDCFTLCGAGWGYLPVAEHPAGGQLWLIGDWMPLRKGTLTINLVGGYFVSGAQGLLTAFYTHSINERLSIWGEAFMYVPEAPGATRSRYGGGIGGQVLLEAAQRTAFDLAMNVSTHGIQMLFGISRKFVLSAPRQFMQP